jgi:hypothetical protein
MMLVLLAACALSFVVAAQADDTEREIISRYVVTHTGWKRSVFRIEKGAASHGIVRYEVIYIPEEKLVFVGGGKSFAIEYDPAKQKVIHEWHYQ